MKFKVIVREDLEDGGYNVSCPTLPGCHSQGETIQEAIECYLESLEKDNLPIPVVPRVEIMEVLV